jgi:hypothetical protein
MRLAGVQFAVAGWVVLAGTVLTGCETSKPPPVGPTNLGYQCLPVPSEWNAAGSVIGISGGGVFQIGQVEGINVQTSLVGVPKYSSTSSVEAGLVLKTLETFTAAKGWAANIAANAKGTVNVTTSYGGSTGLAITSGQPEPAAMKWFKRMGFRIESGTRYYLIREAIQATEISYEVKRSDLAKIGGEATVKAIEGKVNVIDRQASDTYALNATFAKPLNVCIKPVELIAEALSATGEQFLGFTEVKSEILPAK